MTPEQGAEECEMTTTTHAPGPWAIEAPPITLPSAGWIIQDAIGNDVCEGVTTEANARLIAKAPELLACVQQAIDFIEAIAKGETWPDGAYRAAGELAEDMRKALTEIGGESES